MKTTSLFTVLILMSVIFAACGSEPAQVAKPKAEAFETVPDTLNFGPLKRLSLNDASAEEFARVPGVGSRMVREFLEYRPYVSIEQWRTEMAKYIDAETIAAYEEFLYVPVDYNNCDLATMAQISGVNSEMAQTLIDGRPYADRAAFLASVKEVAGGISEQFARYYIIQE
jgi:radical SAM superfamily enzyme with C-terminal helix-hairpin-helix motif